MLAAVTLVTHPLVQFTRVYLYIIYNVFYHDMRFVMCNVTIYTPRNNTHCIFARGMMSEEEEEKGMPCHTARRATGRLEILPRDALIWTSAALSIDDCRIIFFGCLCYKCSLSLIYFTAS